VKPANWPRQHPEAERLLVIDRRRSSFTDATVGRLPELLGDGDLLVLNDAATLPASLFVTDDAGRARELRLARFDGRGATAWVVVFGEGDWRTPTERRPLPGTYEIGQGFHHGNALSMRIEAVSEISPRLMLVSFDRAEASLWQALYQAGTPVQYAYVGAPLALWHVQNRWAARPWAVEFPSAAHALTWSLLLALRRKGVRLARLTHAAGLSSTGDETLDAALPLDESYEIPGDTVTAIADLKRRDGRVVAVGTSVVRALEASVAQHGRLTPGSGEAKLRIGPGYKMRIVAGLLTGMHELSASHFSILRSMVPGALIDAAYAHASSSGYLGHEFGDSTLIL